jgi:hypothetical protein
VIRVRQFAIVALIQQLAFFGNQLAGVTPEGSGWT